MSAQPAPDLVAPKEITDQHSPHRRLTEIFAAIGAIFALKTIPVSEGLPQLADMRVAVAFGVLFLVVRDLVT